MLNVGAPELLVILVVALLVLGPERLPGAARQVGKVVGDLRRMSAGFQAEIRDAIAEGERTISEPFPVDPAAPADPTERPLLGDAPPLAFPADPDAPAAPEKPGEPA